MNINIQQLQQSENKLSFLRRMYKQTAMDKGMSQQRKDAALLRIVQKAKWHVTRIQRINAAVTAAVMEYPVAMWQCDNVSLNGEAMKQSNNEAMRKAELWRYQQQR